MADEQKTEKATPKKRRDERKKGNIFFSNDVVSVAVLLAGFFVLWLCAGWMVDQLHQFFRYCMGLILEPVGSTEVPQDGLALEFVFTCGKVLAPLMGAVVAAGLIATFFQTKLLVSGESMRPKLSRISPIQGFKRLFSMRSIVEALKGLLKISVLLFLIYRYIAGLVNLFTKYLYTDVISACAHLFEESFWMAVQIGVAFAVLAAADVFYQWWDYERQLRMSKQEIKEEFKQTEGDPKIKGKIKEAQRKLAQSRMMQQVPKADVVIRNPTHFAVALRYRPDQDLAPVVLAKGQDEMAARIVRTAEEYHVAVVENVPLARALYGSVDINQMIPPELYNAVAEVLVYLYRMDQKLP